MSKKHIVINLDISFYNQCFIGGGKGGSNIDMYTLKDSEDKPYIPASTIKGRVRANFSMLLKTFYKNKKDAEYIVTKWFGEGGNKPGKLYFDDLKMEGNDLEKSYMYDVRNGITVDRYRRCVRDRALYNIQTAGAGGNEHFQGQISGYVLEEDYEEFMPYLFTAVKMIKTIGGSQSRGIGWLSDDSVIELGENGEDIEKWGVNCEI